MHCHKRMTEGISAYAYLFMFSFFGGGGEKWGMKDKKNNDRRGGVWGGAAPQKPEHFDARKLNRNHICAPPHGFINEILTPPPFEVQLFS